jgi:hypothetical protein
LVSWIYPGDGSFQIKLTPKWQNTISHSCGDSNRSKTNTLLKLIQNEFGGSGYRKFQDTYYYSSGSFINAKRLID